MSGFLTRVAGWVAGAPRALWGALAAAVALAAVHFRARRIERKANELEDHRARAEVRDGIEAERARRIGEMLDEEIQLAEDVDRVVEGGRAQLAGKKLTDAKRDAEAQQILADARARARATWKTD